MRKYLGWDCAHKTIAWSHIEVNLGVYADLRYLSSALHQLVGARGVLPHHTDATFVGVAAGIISAAMNDQVFVDMLTDILRRMRDVRFIVYHSCDVRDILDGRLMANTSPIERTRALRSMLENTPSTNVSPDTMVIIEEQPGRIGTASNNPANAVASQLAFHYAHHPLVFIDAKKKNSLTLGPGLLYAEYLARELPRHKKASDARYAARKRHSRDSHMFLLSVLGLSHVIDHIPAGVRDDAADSTMEILAHLVSTNAFV
jgi:hypothetical protein